MKGIQYLVNEKGEKTGVVLDLALYKDLWEDIYDTLLAESRKDEEEESLESFKERMKAQGRLKQ